MRWLHCLLFVVCVELKIGEEGIEPPSRPYDGILVIAVCTLSKVTVNYVCCQCTTPLCCPGELPGKLILAKQDGWFFCYKEKFDCWTILRVCCLYYKGWWAESQCLNGQRTRASNNPNNIPNSKYTDGLTMRIEHNKTSSKVGLRTANQGQESCPVSLEPLEHIQLWPLNSTVLLC